MSFFLASLYKMRIERQAKLENIGVKEMHKEIKDLQKEAENNKSIENKKNGVFIGIDEATKKQVYSNYNSKHILVGGTTGSGKTTLLANYILDAVKNNYGLVIVDGKGDTGEKSILEKQVQKGSESTFYTIPFFPVFIQNSGTAGKQPPGLLPRKPDGCLFHITVMLSPVFQSSHRCHLS